MQLRVTGIRLPRTERSGDDQMPRLVDGQIEFVMTGMLTLAEFSAIEASAQSGRPLQVRIEQAEPEGASHV